MSKGTGWGSSIREGKSDNGEGNEAPLKEG